MSWLLRSSMIEEVERRERQRIGLKVAGANISLDVATTLCIVDTLPVYVCVLLNFKRLFGLCPEY